MDDASPVFRHSSFWNIGSVLAVDWDEWNVPFLVSAQKGGYRLEQRANNERSHQQHAPPPEPPTRALPLQMRVHLHLEGHPWSPLPPAPLRHKRQENSKEADRHRLEQALDRQAGKTAEFDINSWLAPSQCSRVPDGRWRELKKFHRWEVLPDSRENQVDDASGQKGGGAQVMSWPEGEAAGRQRELGKCGVLPDVAFWNHKALGWDLLLTRKACEKYQSVLEGYWRVQDVEEELDKLLSLLWEDAAEWQTQKRWAIGLGQKHINWVPECFGVQFEQVEILYQQDLATTYHA